MATPNGNLAYDLSVYEPKKQSPQAQEKPRIEVKTNPNPVVRRESSFKFFLKAALVLAILCAVLYGKVESNRLFNEISSLEAQLQALEAENITLAAKYESATSVKNVEDYAQNVLGLQKLDKAQIEYIELEGDTVIEVVEAKSRNVFVIIQGWFADLCEYLGA
ncbi:MAG: hypothetical protein IJ424_07940 [Oscillospiraceae bacterium]|nr:hypothetical protein [Oscillospiraceae bacterium]